MSTYVLPTFLFGSTATFSIRIIRNLFKIIMGCALMANAGVALSQITVQAESYSAMSGVQTENTSDTGGGLNVGWLDAGDWMSYSITLPSAGKYTVSFRVASPNGGGSFRLEKAGGAGAIYGNVSVAATGGWQNWQTITQEMTLPAGQQAIGLAVTGSGFNINWIKFEPQTVSSSSSSSLASSSTSSQSSVSGCAFSTTLQAEDYLAMSGVQTETTTDTGGGLNLGWIDAGDWASYRPVAIPFTGAYKVSYRVASLNGNGVIRLEQSLLSSVFLTNVPATAGWQNWVTVTQDVTLAGGTQTFKIAVPSGGYNINWIKIEAAVGCSSSASTTSSSASSSSDRNLYTAPRATTAPVIDGVADTVWNKAAWAPIDVFWLGSQHPSAQDFSGRYKAMWDAGNLYLLVDITDDILFDATTNPLERYWDDDSVEIFIDENKNGGNHQYNTSAWAYHVSTLGDTVDFTNTTSVQLLNNHITVRRVSSGSKHLWEMSVRIYGENYSDNATNIPLTLFAGKLMGFSICYNDNDASAQRESMIGSVDTQGHKNDMGYKDASVFGSMRLVEAP